jgi:glyoxylase-like metal-dependent hydrolase (beta-lactamase superfamily II)
MYVKQLLIGQLNVFCYIIGCEQTKEAIVIDPGGDEDLILEQASEAGYKIKYIFNTHKHWDHTSGNARLKELTQAKIVIHKLDAENNKNIDIYLDEENTFQVGEINFQIFHTPGHTSGGICLYSNNQLFTGDTLFVGDSGRTDLPGGDRSALSNSIKMLMKLPDNTIVWPGHNYGPTPSSTIGWEKRNNVNAKEYGFYLED